MANRLVQHNVLAMWGRAVEAAGDVDTIHARRPDGYEFIPADGAGLVEQQPASRSRISQMRPSSHHWLMKLSKGGSIVVLAKREFNLRGRELGDTHDQFIAFSAMTRMSGVDLDGRMVRKGAANSIIKFVCENSGQAPADLDGIVQKISRAGGTPLVVADRGKVLGVIYLKDIIKQGIRERFARLHATGGTRLLAEPSCVSQ